MAPPVLYQYLDYRRFLDDWFTEKKASNPRFSHRIFARRANLRSPSFFLAVVQRKRDLTPSTLEGFIEGLGLRNEEEAFFSALVAFDQAETAEERERAWERIRATRRFREARRIEGD